MQYVIDRLKERATWIGLIGLATAAGLVIQPAYQDAIIAAGTGLASLISMVTKG